ncbi:RICIN domain-containing protein [Streptomyces sp. DT195]|uniref:RICIN domain-containing protein n=1 Tax=Streptomyces sp. DT195 TaxID=3393419 RepID=UPI003CEADE1D
MRRDGPPRRRPRAAHHSSDVSTTHRSCNGTGAQKWNVGSDASLRNSNSGLCLDDPNSATAEGTRLQIYACNGSAAPSGRFRQLEPRRRGSTVEGGSRLRAGPRGTRLTRTGSRYRRARRIRTGPRTSPSATTSPP